MADDGAAPTHDRSSEPDTTPPQRTPTFSDYLRIFSYATRWDFFVYAVAAVASVGAGIALPLMNIVFGQLVGQFTDYFRDAAALSREDFDRILDRQALYIMGLFLARWGLSSVNKFCFRMIGIRMSAAVRRHYLQSLLAQSIHAIDSMPAGAPATAITATSATLQIGISERLGTFLQFTATIFAAIIVAFIWSWDLTLVTSSLLLYILVVLSLAVPSIVKGQTETVQADAQGTAIASEALQGIRLVMACGAQSRILSRYEKWVQEALKKAQRIAPVVGIQLGCVFFGVFGAFGLAFWYGIQRYIAGAIDNAGVVIIVLMSVMMILTSLERISTPLIAVSKAMVAACELFTVIDAPLPPSGSLKPDIAGEDLVFTDLSFAYPSRPGVKVLDRLNARIRHGQNTALVGPSGSGKSTLVALLERWYSLSTAKLPDQSNDQNDQLDEESKVPVELEPSGSIVVGGHNIEDIDLHWWRTQIGLVQQEPFLFNDTIFGNVANGLIGTELADESEERKRQLVQEACQEAYAHEFIDLLPDKYDTKVGDGGMKLSGGQKQRIAIARSIIKKPRILILDEATSAIDVRGERIVQAALDKVSQGRTTITIAHRLATIKKADHIIVLQKGQVVEEGTHSGLLTNKDGVYKNLVQAQSLHLENDEEQPDTLVQAYDTKSEKATSNSEAAAHTSTGQPTKTKKSRSLASTFPKLLYDQRVYWPLYLVIVASSMATAAGTPIQAWLFAKVIDTFLLQGDELKKESDFWGLMWLALAGGVGLSYFALGWVSLRAQYFISAAYKMRYLTDMLYQKPRFFDEDSNSHGALTSQIAGDAKQLEELFGINLASWLSGVWTVIGCVIISLVFGWKLGLVAMFVTMPIMLACGFWKYRHEVQFDQMNSAVFMESSQFATEAINAIRTVSSLTMEPTINNRYQRLLQGHVEAARRKAQWTAALYGFADSASLGCQALVFYYGGRLLASGEYTLEAFFVCFMAIIQGAENAASVLANAPSAAQAATAANRIFDMQESADVDQGGTESDGDIPKSDGGIQIELRDVHFKYPTRDVSVLEGLNLRIEKGQYAALVGPSGSGKTTVISLLERFYELESNQGAILCNGTNINELRVFNYRQNLSLVAQEPTMFRGTVRDNILFGIADPSSVSEERLHEVCRDAFIHDFIISLPEGYDTDVGQKEISGGQKQRIAIARALIRNPKIILLDEATSALDSESEKIIQAAIEKARAGRTIVAVAHRLSTIQSADVIFVLDQGTIVEKGSHSDLVKKQGVYWEMCQSQALDQ
ncbi:P-loop containing nucleoside triphosphate hydrolase protein [Hypoxylon rubiginosum]|uniref:P-loop containing nucleoside triphosphate hydrolase protein n=1 Tax=Hypoxylon rubiginosum TaxID=110542 RepID=A0ACB9YX43_9PEZI|nr:P-loop containing nucleoside triphosphate hydrolase protein [Hypoxylon rubiginosum]